MSYGKLGRRSDIDSHQSPILGGSVSRLQLALNVNDIDEAVAFYSKLFAAEPRLGGEPRPRRQPQPSRHRGARRRHRRRRAGPAGGIGSRFRRRAGHHVLLCPAGQVLGAGHPGRRAVGDLHRPGRQPHVLGPGRQPERGCGRGRARRRGDCPVLRWRERSGARRRGCLLGRLVLLAAGQEPVSDMALGRRLLAELLGSAFLAAVVIGSGIAAQRLSPSDTGLELLENAAATAAGLFAIILMFGPVSGGHFNPVVSFADAALGGLSWRDAAAYLPAQVAGCTAGAIAANLMFSGAAVSISTAHRGSPAHFLSEVIATLGLILVIF